MIFIKRSNLEDKAFCGTFHLKDFTQAHKMSRKYQYHYADLIKNDFKDFIWNKIYDIEKESEEFSNALKIVKGQEKNADKVVSKEERKEEIKKAYSICLEKVKEKEILKTDKVISEFRAVMDKKFYIWLPDDVRYNLLLDVMQGFVHLFYYNGKDVVKEYGEHTCALRAKPMYATKKDGTISDKKQGSASIIFRDGKAYYRIWDLRPEAVEDMYNHLIIKEIDYNGKKRKIGIKFDTPSGQCPNHKYVEYEICYNEKDPLQKELMKNIHLGATKLVRYWKKGEWRYRVQVNFEEISPIVEEISPQNNHVVGVDWGTETVAIVRDDGYQEIIELTPNTPRVTDKIKKCDIKMDTSRRLSNPDFYLEDGRIKYTKEEMRELGLVWKYSNNYIKIRNVRRECYRKLTETRKINNYALVKNKIFTLGNCFHTEFNTFKAWGMKGNRMAEKTKEKFLTNNRRDYTKQIHDRAPRWS